MMSERIRLGILEASIPIVKILGSVSAPFSHKKVTGTHFYHLMSRLTSGVVLVTRTSGELSNLLIPGRYSHAAIYTGVRPLLIDGQPVEAPVVAEAVGSGTRARDLLSFLTSKDEVLAFAPAFASEDQMATAADWAMTKLGIPYDFTFEPTNKAFYCSEFVQASYAAAIGSNVPFTKRTTLGVSTVIPQDYVNAKDKWRQIWWSEELKTK